MRPYLLLSSFLVALVFAEPGFLPATAGDCPLDMSWWNLTAAASVCSDQNERAKCCRYINAFIAVSVAYYANATGELGVPSAFSDACYNSISDTLKFSGIPSNATMFCGLGLKIHISYQCEGRVTISDMLQSPNFYDVIRNCKLPLSLDNSCKRCLNSGLSYLRHLVGDQDNVTLNTCRDAAFVALANQGDNSSIIDVATCFFSVKGLSIHQGNSSEPFFSSVAPATSPASAPIRAHDHFVAPFREHHHPFQLTLIPGIGASTMFHRYSHKEIKKASGNFCKILGKSEFGILYKAQFDDGFVAAVKQIKNMSVLSEEDFCREMEILGRLHHRHLVTLRGFCSSRQERFMIYEFMENGSLKDQLYSSGRTPLPWKTRIQIAIDVANALVAYFGLEHSTRCASRHVPHNGNALGMSAPSAEASMAHGDTSQTEYYLTFVE
ncbi:STYKc [Musa troglodytarum]|uniref:STYKc n=1 Tax=Musa troglodytarum TaxID=320322 RepID=A0A9E7GHK0_9LILI|nr:STYKc [Musa troglodytarum]